jgi:microcystin-dependent protein
MDRILNNTGSGGAGQKNSSVDMSMIFPSGVMLPFAGLEANVPQGWLLCYGQAINISDYPTLYAAIGTNWNTVWGASAPAGTQFRVPDMRGSAPVGKDNMGGSSAGRLVNAMDGTIMGNTGGFDYHYLTVAEMPSHSHGQDAHNHSQNSHGHSAYRGGDRGGPNQGTWNHDGTGVYGGKAGYTQAGGGVQNYIHVNDATASNNAATINIYANGGGGWHPIIQPTVVVNYIIKI